MKYFLWLGIAVSVFLSACAKSPPSDAELMQGSWVAVAASLGGQPVSEAVLKGMSFKVDKGQYEVHSGTAIDYGTFVLDATTTPKSMTITGTEGFNKGKTFPAIYELNGDTLRICHDLSGKQRPTDFTSTAGTELYLVTYQRKKE